MTTIGFIGSGMIGRTVAGLALAAGHQAVLSNSRGPDTLGDIVADLGAGAEAATVEAAAKAADLVVVAIPVRAEPGLPVAELADRIVLDADNYYPQRDGQIAALDAGEVTSAGLLQVRLPSSRVVKVFNHIQFSELASQGQPAGTDGRRALAVFGDDADAKATVSGLLDEFGYDAVDGGPLSESWRIEPGQPAYGPRMTSVELTSALAAATR